MKIKDYHVKIDARKLFNQPVKNDLRTHDDIWNITNGYGDDCTTARWLYNWMIIKLVQKQYSKLILLGI